MDMPPDCTLKFFTYGLFKPGQLGYHQIAKFVESLSHCKVQGDIYQRDGMPLFINQVELEKQKRRIRSVEGHLLNFRKNNCKDAYKMIVKMEPKEYYRWETVEIEGSTANVLHGVKPFRGSSEISVIDEHNCWDGSQDPLFIEAIKEVEKVLEENSNGRSLGLLPVIRLQMAYLLLWVAIERYVVLRYGMDSEGVLKNICKIAEEEEFSSGLRTHVTKSRDVYSTKNPRDKLKLAADNPEGAIKYYYQIRSNVAHRGKSHHSDFDILKLSLSELLPIFKSMLSASFNHSN